MAEPGDYARFFSVRPTIEDMRRSGLWLDEALGLLERMDQEDHPPEYWWAIILPTKGSA